MRINNIEMARYNVQDVMNAILNLCLSKYLAVFVVVSCSLDVQDLTHYSIIALLNHRKPLLVLPRGSSKTLRWVAINQSYEDLLPFTWLRVCYHVLCCSLMLFMCVLLVTHKISHSFSSWRTLERGPNVSTLSGDSTTIQLCHSKVLPRADFLLQVSAWE